MSLKHSHIAVRRALKTLARAVGAAVAGDRDDLGPYRYFDLVISHEDGDSQRIRFASHAGDQMVHVLAERIDLVSDLAAALFAVGVGSKSELSISVDQEGKPVRSADEIRERIATMSHSEKGNGDYIELAQQSDGNLETVPTIAMH
ncbi:hypothetical protein [Hoeflea sp.]|uniref:hypothetical protein n=1 Tax=Hoeflea sp. TaxID=1940281 RepID=UPI003B52B962